MLTSPGLGLDGARRGLSWFVQITNLLHLEQEQSFSKEQRPWRSIERSSIAGARADTFK